MADGEDVAVVVGGLLFLVLPMVLSIALYASRYKRVPPNRAMVVFGRRAPSGRSTPPRPNFRIVRSGGKFIVPIVESYAFLSLEPVTVEGEMADVSVAAGSPDRGPVNVRMQATVRIADSPESLELAATNLLNLEPDELKRIVSMTIEADTRKTLGTHPATSDHELTGEVLQTSRETLRHIGLDLFALVLTRRRA